MLGAPVGACGQFAGLFGLLIFALKKLWKAVSSIITEGAGGHLELQDAKRVSLGDGDLLSK